MVAPTAIAILVPNVLSSKPPPVIPKQLTTVPIDVIHIPSTLRMLTSSVLLRRYDTMYGEKFPVKDRELYFHTCFFKQLHEGQDKIFKRVAISDCPADT